MKKAITGSKLFNGLDFIEHKALLIDGQNIAGIVNEGDIPTDFKIQKLDGGILSPGFIDLQVNGGGGKLFNNSEFLIQYIFRESITCLISFSLSGTFNFLLSIDKL